MNSHQRMKRQKRAKRPARVARLAAKAAGKHAQRHGLFLQEILRAQGVEAYEAELVKRSACEKCAGVA